MSVSRTIVARGHANILATNRTTFEITKDEHLSRKGDCIVAVSADKALSQLDDDFKKKIRRDGAILTVLVEADGMIERVVASGSALLTLSHSTDIVVRKSSFISERTLAIRAEKAACDFSRKLVEKLQNPEQQVIVTLNVEC